MNIIVFLLFISIIIRKGIHFLNRHQLVWYLCWFISKNQDLTTILIIDISVKRQCSILYELCIQTIFVVELKNIARHGEILLIINSDTRRENVINFASDYIIIIINILFLEIFIARCVRCVCHRWSARCSHYVRYYNNIVIDTNSYVAV